MKRQSQPYFLKNKEWYVENKEWYVEGVPYFLIKGAKKPQKRQYMLTDKAPQEAVDSYKQYYEEIEN